MNKLLFKISNYKVIGMWRMEGEGRLKKRGGGGGVVKVKKSEE